jgi:hypothetical protein
MPYRPLCASWIATISVVNVTSSFCRADGARFFHA